ncbi:MAG: indolepyruvate ferredoxin oxidoreductase subunit alpha [Desulfohalobiaceae bacterium]
MTDVLLSNNPGSRHLLLGNEAIVRGALEAGVGFVSCYPGTPSSEAPDTFYRLAPQGQFYFEYSVNEKVALEVGGGAALSGVPTLVTMKHVGLNVAADPLMSLAYIGTPGGLVILSADDPGCHSSQNEQDNRYYARLARLPCFEPSTAQEAKDMASQALQLSAKWQQPVLLRTTTRLNHLRGVVEFSELRPAKSKSSFQKEPRRFVPLPAIARTRHPILLHNMQDIQAEAENSSWNRLSGQGRLGIICSGMSRAYLQDALWQHSLQDRFQILELGFSYPLPQKNLLEFCQDKDKVLVLEELDPLLEEELRALVQRHGAHLEIQGKNQTLGRTGEYSVRSVGQRLLQFLDQEPGPEELCEQESGLPARPPNLCAGCAHRAMYYAVRQVFGDQAVYSTDIGCYTLGFLPPLRAADFLFCMGSSVSGAGGMSKCTDQPLISYIGDSTFFHSGITGLVNAVYNQHNLLLIILDNKTTAMTGHQPHPGVEESLQGPNASRVDIEQVVRGCGVEQVKKVKPLNHKATVQALQDFKAASGVRVLIAEEPCVLFARRVLGRKRPKAAYVQSQHPEVTACLQELACPAFYVQQGEVQIDENQCAGCMYCIQLTQHIKAKSRS